MRFLHESAIVFYVSVGIRILQHTGKDVRSQFHSVAFASPHFNALRNGTGVYNGQCLREDAFVYEHYIGSRFLHVARA